MTLTYLLTRLSKIGATLTEQSKYVLVITEQNGSIRDFPSRDAIYKHYFTRKYGDEKKVVKRAGINKKYVRL